MKTLQKTLIYLCISAVLITGISCSNDNEPNNTSNLVIKSKATLTPSQSRLMANAALEITEFKLNIKEIELEYDSEFENEDENADGYMDSEEEIELQGPFELDLLAGTSNIVTVELPEANYEEIEFEFDTNTDNTSDMFGRTVVIQGTIDSTPFIFWHDFEEEIEVDYEDGMTDISVTEGVNDVIINFDLDALLAQIDLTTATDNNADGTIEISPTDTDGNNELAEAIKEQLKETTELLDD